MVQGADDAARQEQRHGDEQTTKYEQPIGREDSGGEVGFGVVDQNRAERRANQCAAAADGDPDHRLDRIAGLEFARIDDAHLRHVQRAGDAGHARGQSEYEELVGFDAVTEKPRPRFGVPDGDQHLAELRRNDAAADQEADNEREAGNGEQRIARGFRAHIESEDILEVRQPVVAAEPEIIAKKSELKRIGERLGDDRQIDAGDAASKSKPAEHEGKYAGNQYHHESRIGKVLEAVPVDRQLFPVQEHHEVGKDRIGVDAARADLAHQIHAHGVSAQRKEGAMTKRENAAIAPDKIDRERQNRVAGVFAEERDQIGRDVERRSGRHKQIEDWDRDADAADDDQEDDGAAIER